MERVGPRFSVVLPVCEGVDNAGRAAVSVLAQTFGDVELIVAHDGGHGAALDAVRLFADRRVRMVRASPEHPALDGLAACRGRRVAVIDTATHARPNWLARCGRLIDQTGADLVFCGGSQHHVDGSCSEIRPAPHCLRPGAVIGSAQDVADLLCMHTDPAELLDSAPGGRGRSSVNTPEPLLDWFEQVPLGPQRGDRLRLRWACEAIDVLSESPIPDVGLLARYATIGGVAAARLRDHAEARRLFAMARRLLPGELKPFARWAVASIPALSDRVWDPERDQGVAPEPL